MTMILQETYTLSNGVAIPKLGLGTWLIPDNEAAAAVEAAIDLGYKHIDTAQAYGNERGVGEGVRASGVPRDQVFITTKVAAENKTYASAAASIDESLRKLECGPADLVIIHCPQPWAEFRGSKRYFKENKEVWKALEDACLAGKVKAIGVSNFLSLVQQDGRAYIDVGEKYPLDDCPMEIFADGQKMEMGVRSNDVAFDNTSPIRAKVRSSVFLGSEYNYFIQLGNKELRVQQNALDVIQHGEVKEGQEIGLRFLQPRYYPAKEQKGGNA